MVDDKIQLHHDFWNRKNLKRPLVSFHPGEDFFFSRHYRAAYHLLENGKRISPDMLDVDAFMEDYERIYQTAGGFMQDGFWCAQPYTGIPWMEGILGCEIFATENSYISRPWVKSLDETDGISFDPKNPWFLKYMEFIEKLVKLSDGRFPVGEPIMRGPSDMAGALLGQSEMVFAIVDDPGRMKRLFKKVAEIFMEVIARHYKEVKSFKGGYSFGFYPVWSPEKCIWFQEDLSAILSPDHFSEFLKEPAEMICKDYDYTAVHLHPASFFIVDELLKIDRLKAIEVNKDIGGPTVAEMIPIFRRILEKKNLIVWGDLDEADIDVIAGALPPRGIYLNPVVPDADRANALMNHMLNVA
jgi:hypothetical protein